MKAQFFNSWIHIPKYVDEGGTTRTRTAPYFIMRRGAAAWDTSTSTWTTTGSTYANLAIRPTWNANANIFIFELPQISTVGRGHVSLLMMDAAEGAEAITDPVLWGGMIEIEKRPDGSLRFVDLPISI